MTHTIEKPTGREDADPLRTLAGYLEASLDAGASLIVMRHSNDTATFYLGDPSGPREELKRRATASATLARQILDHTRAGINVIELDGTTYRFFRSFTQVEDAAAVVFTPT